MASDNFSLDLPDNFVRLEARKSVPGVGVRDEEQVGGGDGAVRSHLSLQINRSFNCGVCICI